MGKSERGNERDWEGDPSEKRDLQETALVSGPYLEKCLV